MFDSVLAIRRFPATSQSAKIDDRRDQEEVKAMSKLSFSQPHSFKVRGVFRATQIAAFLFAFVCLVCAAPTFAQTSQGFTGVVTDSTGAVIPKALVKVHNQATGVDKDVVTTNSGSF